MDCSTPDFPVHHCLWSLHSNSCPLSQWCHPTISSSVTPFSSCPQSFPASGSFPKSWLFASDGQSINTIRFVKRNCFYCDSLTFPVRMNIYEKGFFFREIMRKGIALTGGWRKIKLQKPLFSCCQLLSHDGLPMNCSMPGFPFLHYLLEPAPTHVHWVGDAI